MDYLKRIVERANEWLELQKYDQLSHGEVVAVVKAATKALEIIESKPEIHDSKTLEQLLALYACKAVCKLRGIKVPDIIERSDFKFDWAKEEFVNE